MHISIKVFAMAIAIAAAVTPAAIIIAPKIGAMDVPKDNRRMHDHAIPRFGGIAIYLGIIVTSLVFVPMSRQFQGILAGATLITLLGIVDDIKGLRPKVKLAGQIACAIVPFILDVRVRGIGELMFPLALSCFITVVWIVGITNTINLIDGLDGLAAGVACIAGLSVAYTSYLMGRPEVSVISLALAGSCVGFLIYNSHPAKIFMGDAGSMLLGFVLACVSLVSDTPTKGTTLFAVIIPLITLALPIFDTAFAIVRRAANHRPIMQADKGHLHHRIMAMGFGQRRTVLALYCISAIMGIAGILWTSHKRMEALVLTMIAMCLIVVFLGIGLHHKKPEDAAAERAPEASGTEDSK